MIKKLINYSKLLLLFLTRFPQTLRILYLNTKPNVSINLNIVLDKSAKISLHPDGFKCGGQISIGKGVRISNNVVIAPYGGSIEIQENVFVGPFCVLYGHGGLRIGHDTLIATHTVIIPANHSFDNPSTPIAKQPLEMKGIIIAEDVWIGSGAKILDGVTIGKGAVVGAGSVVNKTVDEYSIVAGVPAKKIRRRTQ